MRIERAPDLLFDLDAQAALLRDELASWIPREALIGSALARPEISERSSGDARVTTFLPRLTVRGEHRRLRGLTYRSGLGTTDAILDDGAGTTLANDRYWATTVELRWAPPGRRGGAFVDSFADVSADDFNLDLGGVAGSDGGQSLRRDASLYGGELARKVSELYTARAEAIQRRVTVSRAPILQQVHLELHIAQIEADLDALTAGSVSAWKPSSSAPAPSSNNPRRP